MTTTPTPDVPLPAGLDLISDWENGQRSMFGSDRNVTDHKLRVYPWAVQNTSGLIDGCQVELVDDEDPVASLNSDQARELAAALLEAAAEGDGWMRC
jgi:hypothetical protein